MFCPNTDGAFKQTTTNRWAHLLCAIWIPEVRLANPSFMEPVEGVDLVPKSRWKLVSLITLDWHVAHNSPRTATYASNGWVRASSAAIGIAFWHFTLRADGGRGYT